jgi:hypothetical protein
VTERPGGGSGPATLARLPLLILLAWWTLRLGTSATSGCFLDYVNLPFHEAGHLFLAPFGSTLHYLGGTLGQLAVPIALAGYFLIRERRPFAAACCAWWIGESFVNISVYMADARELRLPLVGGGDHDWNELFYRLGLLGEGSVAAAAAMTHAAGVILMLAGLAWASFFTLPAALRDSVQGALTRRLPALRFLLE